MKKVLVYVLLVNTTCNMNLLVIVLCYFKQMHVKPAEAEESILSLCHLGLTKHANLFCVSYSCCIFSDIVEPQTYFLI